MVRCRPAKLVKKVAEAVAYAHEKGVIHRDLKPANVLLDANGEPKVTDFGLAKQVESDSDLTRTGAVMGTPSYMPPEQAGGKTDEVGPRSDVYSLGAILYCLLTGRPPFQASNAVDTLLQVIEHNPALPRSLNRDVPVDLESVCMKCLSKRPGHRYDSAQDLVADLQRFLVGEPVKARRQSRVRLAIFWMKRHPAHVAFWSFLAFGVVAFAWRFVVSPLLGVNESLVSVVMSDFSEFLGFGFGSAMQVADHSVFLATLLFMILLGLLVLFLVWPWKRVYALEVEVRRLRTQSPLMLQSQGELNSGLRATLTNDIQIENAIAEIETAFAGVQLGEGISLREADVIDDYGTDEERLAARAQDEVSDWRKISDELIEQHSYALCFMDPKGLRFHLPAHMRFTLRRYRDFESLSSDASISALCRSDCIIDLPPILTDLQLQAIRTFLTACLGIGEDYLDVAPIPLALCAWAGEQEALEQLKSDEAVERVQAQKIAERFSQLGPKDAELLAKCVRGEDLTDTELEAVNKLVTGEGHAKPDDKTSSASH